jgi:phosphopantothenoylcysteine decarboxylase
MANVLLGVTGSVAAIRTPLLYQGLTAAGHAVKVVATDPALYFFDPAELPGGVLHVDADEWPRAPRGERYVRDDPVLHIELRRWAGLFLVAPLDANTLAKFAVGLCDNCLTCVWRAWDPARPALLAPAMNTLMWEHPATARHIRQLILDHGGPPAPPDADLSAVVAWLNAHCPRLRVVPPIVKRLADGDVGMGGMAEVPDLLVAAEAALKLA